LISINILPSSHWFHVLRPLRDHDGVVMLDREAFTHLDTDLWRLHRGDGSLALAHGVFDEAMAEVRRQLPARPEPHPDVLEMVRQLDTSPHLTIEELAAALGRTSQWVSRTFSTELDMSMRDYQNWLKQRRVFDLLYTRRSLTQVALESGFGDSPQFSRTFLRWYGRSPSYSRNPHHVRVFIEREPDGMKLVCFRQPAATTNPAS
jgi:AraC-like DNA-binding protein